MPDLIRTGSVEIMRGLVVNQPWLKGHSNSRHRIHPNQIEPKQLADFGSYFPDDLSDRLTEDGDLDLIEFLESCPRARVNVTVFAVDSFSGSLGVDRRDYRLSDIEDGRFNKGMTCEHSGILHESEDEARSYQSDVADQ